MVTDVEGRAAVSAEERIAAVPAWRVLTRFVTVAAVATAYMLPAGAAALVLRIFRGAAAARRFMFRRVARLLQVLGPTFIKYGQIGSTRPDALKPELCEELGVLHDAVVPMSRGQADRALAAAFSDAAFSDGDGPEPPAEIAEIDRTPIASGSIAGVYRARLRDGSLVALKVKRPGIDGRMAADLALLRAVVRACERLPKLRGMPMSDLIGYVSIAVLGQLDFEREAANIVRLRRTLAKVPGVRVPELLPELCRPGCLAFEYIEGLDRRTPERLPDETRARMAATVLAAAHTMMFVDGFVHCDLHPGNVYLTADGDVVILDAGYSVQLSDKVRGLIGEFFARMAAGDGRRCGEIVLESAAGTSERTDARAFVDAVAAHVEAHAGPGVTFDMPRFGEKMFDLQRDHGLYAASDFAFPLMSLLVLEGTVQGFAPGADFQQVGVGAR